MGMTGDESLPVVTYQPAQIYQNSLATLLSIPPRLKSRWHPGCGVTMTRDLEKCVCCRGLRGNHYPLILRPGPRMLPSSPQLAVRCRDEHFEVSFSGSYFSNRGMVSNSSCAGQPRCASCFYLAAQFELVQPWVILFGDHHRPVRALVMARLPGQTFNLDVR